ncbi:cytochrome c oxidase assembly protein CtaG [Candidatus Phycosocius spiralis]|uniref:Cytochrome c oxidase assembly protein CtaG n=2 Tax=Candidatus Phycosocius spiralis TaxID=2815099 RepID=A0ABQ4PW28_9PROT|nr:cytochrome c oxidase assembly protein CtaG [Candidatus Phycosocius spiralis]
MVMTKTTRFGLIAAFVPLAMLGASYAAVPLYQLFCQVTGYGGTTQVATAAASTVLSRTIQVRFDANVAPGVPWSFKPEKPVVSLKLGENGLAFYTVKNESDRPVTAVATYNVTPHKVGPYFQKLECFCFQDRTLQPGESMELPVIFYVDPALATDRNVDEVTEVTLSYTFFAVGDKAIQASQGDLTAPPVANP